MQNQLIELLTIHIPLDSMEADHKKRTLDFIANTARCTCRETRFGHVTASAWILSPDRTEVLLTHHKKLNRWLQPGGHVENDRTIQEAATREAREESGVHDLELLDDRIFDIDVHLIPARKADPDHYHYDFRFIFQSSTREFSVSDESHDLAWIKLTEINVDVAEESIIRMANKTRAYL